MSTQINPAELADEELTVKEKLDKRRNRKPRVGGRDATSIPLPEQVDRKRIYLTYLVSFIVFHALALLCFVPWFFSWTGFASLVIGSYFFGAVGIPITYHRLLTHRSFKAVSYTHLTLPTICSV